MSFQALKGACGSARIRGALSTSPVLQAEAFCCVTSGEQEPPCWCSRIPERPWPRRPKEAWGLTSKQSLTCWATLIKSLPSLGHGCKVGFAQVDVGGTSHLHLLGLLIKAHFTDPEAQGGGSVLGV